MEFAQANSKMRNSIEFFITQAYMEVPDHFFFGIVFGFKPDSIKKEVVRKTLTILKQDPKGF